jgi:hypothetical protein
MLMDDKKNRQINNADENAPQETDPALFNPDAGDDMITGAGMNEDTEEDDEDSDED